MRGGRVRGGDFVVERKRGRGEEEVAVWENQLKGWCGRG